MKILKITVQSSRYEEPAVKWIEEMLRFKLMKFKKRTLKIKDDIITTVFEKEIKSE